jgi:hypothetical protein
LYPDLDTLRNTEPLRDAIQNTGAVVMGWNAYAMSEDPESTSCRCYFAEVFGYSKLSALNRFAWKDCL